MLGWVVNICRSFPFIVLMISIIPFTRIVMGTSSGILGTVPPLVLSTSPFIARMVEQSLAEVPRENRRRSIRCCTPRVVFSALLPEAMPSLVRGVAVTLMRCIGYTAIAARWRRRGRHDPLRLYRYQRS